MKRKPSKWEIISASLTSGGGYSEYIKNLKNKDSKIKTNHSKLGGYRSKQRVLKIMSTSG